MACACPLLPPQRTETLVPTVAAVAYPQTPEADRGMTPVRRHSPLGPGSGASAQDCTTPAAGLHGSCDCVNAAHAASPMFSRLASPPLARAP
jgi:hypothetical protein